MNISFEISINHLKQCVHLLNVAFQKNYTTEKDRTLNVPFLAFHFSSDDDEIKFFGGINTKVKKIG